MSHQLIYTDLDSVMVGGVLVQVSFAIPPRIPVPLLKWAKAAMGFLVIICSIQ